MGMEAVFELQTQTPYPLYGDHESKVVRNLIMKTKEL
jgi:hypothetical protein